MRIFGRSYENLGASQNQLDYNRPNDASSQKIKLIIIEIIKIIIVLTTVVLVYRFNTQNSPAFPNEPIKYTTTEQKQIPEAGRQLFNRLPEYNEKEQYQLFKEMQEKQANETKIDGEYAEDYLTDEIKKLIKEARHADIHYFVEDPHNHEDPKVINIAQPYGKEDVNEKRPLIRTEKTTEQLERIVRAMENPFRRRVREYFNRKPNLSSQLTNMVNFAYTLSLYPKYRDYLEAEFYRLDKLYEIGKYGKQLPICLVLVGKNNGHLLLRLYESISYQNYTNYRIAHMDDNSNDSTQQQMQFIFSKYPHLKKRTTFLTQSFQHNALYNRHYANSKICQDGDIIIDIDTDDYLIGTQVLQLVNSLYQAGNQHEGKNEEVWALFLNFVTYFYQCCPGLLLHGQIDEKIIKQQTYRISGNFRTTHLRTYLRKIYQKIDPKDYVDEVNLMKGGFYPESSDLIMMDAVFELSAPRHIKFVDESVYFYTGSGNRDQTYPEYCSASGRSLPIYQPIKTLDDPPVRGPTKRPPDYKQNMKKKAEARMQGIKKQVLQLYQAQKLKRQGE